LGGASRLVTVRGPMQMGHWKQLRVHLGGKEVSVFRGHMICRVVLLHAPVALALQVAAGNLEQAARAVVGHDLLGDAARTPDLVAVFAVHQVLERVQAVVGPRGARVEVPVVIAAVTSSARGRRRSLAGL
jgi:hypothetical protein